MEARPIALLYAGVMDFERTLALMGAALLCTVSCKEPAETEETDERRKKQSAATASASAEPEVPLFFGDEAAFDGPAGLFAVQAELGGAPHSPEEPDFFDPGWVGREAKITLDRAKNRELVHTTVHIGGGLACIAFHEPDRLVRRALVGSFRADQPVEETTYSAAGRPIIWFRHDRGDPAQLEWAFFHRGPNLQLYQKKVGTGARETLPAPAGFAARVLDHADACLAKLGATNGRAAPPPPVTAAPPPLVPPLPPPGGGGGTDPKVFGAVAYGKTTSRWGVATQRTSAADARNAAVQFCGRSDCAVEIELGRGQCVSVAHGAGNFVAWGYGAGLDAARANMQAYCTKQGQSCTTQGEWCNES
jgi:hypothetical protein